MVCARVRVTVDVVDICNDRCHRFESRQNEPIPRGIHDGGLSM